MRDDSACATANNMEISQENTVCSFGQSSETKDFWKFYPKTRVLSLRFSQCSTVKFRYQSTSDNKEKTYGKFDVIFCVTRLCHKNLWQDSSNLWQICDIVSPRYINEITQLLSLRTIFTTTFFFFLFFVIDFLGLESCGSEFSRRSFALPGGLFHSVLRIRPREIQIGFNWCRLSRFRSAARDFSSSNWDWLQGPQTRPSLPPSDRLSAEKF